MMTYPLRTLSVFLVCVSAIALASALIAQFVFGLRPCLLCHVQRVPFVIAGALAGLSLLRPHYARWLLTAAALAFLVNSGIAFYHVGVEQHWWAAACSAPRPSAANIGDLIAQLERPVTDPPCDEPSWSWNGITMALLNVPFSGGVGLAALLVLLRKSRA